jgi:hypothetical protein
MATIAERITVPQPRPDILSGTPRAHSIDRWIFVFMAAWFIVIVLTGFVPDSLKRIAAVRAGELPPFPLVLHFHAVLMGSFLLVLLAQTWLMATGRDALHKQLGALGMVLAVSLIVAGFILAPTIYHQMWDAAHSWVPGAAEKFGGKVHFLENIILMQSLAGISFGLFLAIGLAARARDAGLHKRMMILATAMPLTAAFVRIPLLPTTMPVSPLSLILCVLAAVSPMLVWDVMRNGRVHNAYWIWIAVWLPLVVAVNVAWDTPWWHAIARELMGV